MDKKYAKQIEVNSNGLVTMGGQPSKRTFDEISSDAGNLPASKYLKNTTVAIDSTEKSNFQDLCSDIFLEIFQYLHPVDLLCSFTDLFPHLDTLIAPYTHTLDFRLVNKSCFQCLMQSLLPYLTNNLRVLRLSNAFTFSQISEILYKFDWSQINQLESLTFDSIESNELSKYFVNVHPLLERLWRLSFTFDENDKLAEKLLIDHILTPTKQPLTNCFITGIVFDLNRLIGQKLNENLRELTLTLATINDLIILFRFVPRLEIFTCTVVDSTCNDSIDKIPLLDHLTILSLTIQQPVIFRNLQKILIPHIKLKRLLLKAILCDETSSSNSNQEIGGLVLEKLFRTFSQLTELHFYLRHLQNDGTNAKPDHLYLFSFTSHFWLDRSIQVFTHFVPQTRQRYIYTLPFLFDTFDIVENIHQFFPLCYSYYFANVRHLSLSPTSLLDEYIYSSKIFKFFPNIQTITLSDKPSSQDTIKILNDHRWILQKSSSKTSSIDIYPHVYILNGRKATHWYLRTLDISYEDQRLFANASKRVRQLTIYEMTEQQSVNLNYFFPWIRVLILHVNTLEWFSSSNDWLYNLLTNITSLFSLTIYYPKDKKDEKIRDLFANTLLAVKNHFFIKDSDGILNIWF